MGKFASRDSAGTPVAWGDITGKPSTFDPNPHDNTAHSTAYAPVASPTFTGLLSVAGSGTGTTVNTGSFYTTGDGGQGLLLGMDTTNKYAYLRLNTSAGVYGWQIQKEDGTALMTILNNGNVSIPANLTAGAFKTTNFTILQSGTDLLIQYNGTTVFKLSSAGYLRVANEMEPHAAL